MPTLARLNALPLLGDIDPTHDLRFGNYEGFDFEGADITGWDLSGTRLRGADLTGVRNIDRATFSWQTDLRGAFLPEGVDLNTLLPFFQNPERWWEYDGRYSIEFDPKMFSIFGLLDDATTFGDTVCFTGRIEHDGESGCKIFFGEYCIGLPPKFIRVIRNGTGDLLWVDGRIRNSDQIGTIKPIHEREQEAAP